MSYCHGNPPRYDVECSPDEARYRVNDDYTIRKAPPLPAGVAEWNVRKYGAYCKAHAENAAANRRRNAERWRTFAREIGLDAVGARD